MESVKTKIEIKKLKPLVFYQALIMGADPEFFFSGKDGKVIGSEKVLKDGCLIQDPYKEARDRGWCSAITEAEKKQFSKFVVDGVQAELNPRPNNCRALFGNEIARCFKQLRGEILKKNPSLAVSFAPLVNVTKEEMDSLSEASKVFGCAPSVNIHYTGKDKTSIITVDPKKYTGRSAGGHIHLGNNYEPYTKSSLKEHYENDKSFTSPVLIGLRMKAALENVETMIKMMDIIVGNTCVLLDRDPSNKERRKNYGRAGEHRVKEYGLEYRTLSNFWLRAYPLMSFVMGMSRLAVLIVDQTTEENNYVKAIFDAVNIEDVVKAINENDFDLAYANFKKIEPILLEITRGNYTKDSFPIHEDTIKYFHFFVKRGIDVWFTEDPLEHWCTLPDGHGRGFEAFLQNIVKNFVTEKGIDLNDIKIQDPSVKKSQIRKLRVVAQEVVAV